MTDDNHPVKPKRINNPQAMRSRILDVAADLFQRHGYNATSMHDVVRGAATTGGALHHHFATKKALGLAVIAERVAPEVDATAIQPIATASSAAAGIRNVFNGVADTLERNRAVSGCPLNNLALELSLADADFREAVNGVFERWRLGLSLQLALRQAGDGLVAGARSRHADRRELFRCHGDGQSQPERRAAAGMRGAA